MRLKALLALSSVCGVPTWLCGQQIASSRHPPQLIAVALFDRHISDELILLPIARWRQGRFDDISSVSEEPDNWKHLSREVFPMRGKPSFRLLKDGSPLVKVRPTHVEGLNYGCSFPAGGLAPWPFERPLPQIEGSKPSPSWPALSRNTSHLPSLPPLPEATSEEIQAHALTLAKSALLKGRPNLVFPPNPEIECSTFPLDSKGGRGVFVQVTFLFTEATERSVALVLDVSEPSSLKELFREVSNPVDENEVDVVKHHFIGAMDVDGDGVAEILLRFSYYESEDFVILKRKGVRYKVAFKGAGAGC